MPLITRFEILEKQYNDLYPTLEVSKLVLEALKTLPLDLELEPREERTSMGISRIRITVGDRIKEIERDIKVLGARVEIIKKELELENEKKQETN